MLLLHAYRRLPYCYNELFARFYRYLLLPMLPPIHASCHARHALRFRFADVIIFVIAGELFSMPCYADAISRYADAAMMSLFAISAA